jgi:hypothetical protein
MTDDEALEKINELLGLGLRITYVGDEVKGRRPDEDLGEGTRKFYLDSSACQELSNAFAAVATKLFLESSK